MRLQRKLIPAVVLLLVSCVLLSTASYAWFTSNNTVKATGMQVNAVADKALVIATDNSALGNYGDEAVATLNATIKPCTSFDGINMAKLNGNVYIPSAAEYKAFATGGAALTGAELTAAGNEYYAEQVFYVRTLVESTNLYVKSLTVTSRDHLSKAVRVAVTLDGGNTLVFNPNSGVNGDEGVGKFDTGAWTLASKTYDTVGSTALLGNIAVTTPAETGHQVTVRIWFEGQDTTCYSDLVDATGYSVEIEFTNRTE